MKRILILLVGLLFTVILNAQKKNELSRKEKRIEKKMLLAEKVDSILLTHDFNFLARSVSPVGWSTIHLSSIYKLEISSDSANVHLPYFGRAYFADYISTEGGIKLNESITNYKMERKKENYEIRFEAESICDLYQFYLNINTSGYGSLSIISNNRQVINYNGIIEGIGL